MVNIEQWNQSTCNTPGATSTQSSEWIAVFIPLAGQLVVLESLRPLSEYWTFAIYEN